MKLDWNMEDINFVLCHGQSTFMVRLHILSILDICESSGPIQVVCLKIDAESFLKVVLLMLDVLLTVLQIMV